MTALDYGLPAVVAIVTLIGGLAVAAAVLLVRAAGWRPIAGVALLAATPLIPNVPVAMGFSFDDILPILGLVALATSGSFRNMRRLRVQALLVAGLVLMVAAALLSSLVNATDAASFVTMAARSAGRDIFISAIAVVAAIAVPAARRRRATAEAVAIVGVLEALFGLFAFAVPAIGIGLEPTKSYSVLYHEVPGRIAGTLGISPNFLGAIFILTILLSAGIALDARTRRTQLLWWGLVGVQMLALVLTFTRASLVITIVGLLVLLLSRARARYLLMVGLALLVGFAATPALDRLSADMPDRLALWASSTTMLIDHPLTGVGPGQSVAVAGANPDRYMHTMFGSATNNAHNTILIAGAETGIIGALGSLIVNVVLAFGALAALRRANARRRPAIESAAAVAVLGYLAQGMVNNLFNVAAAGTVFVLVLGAFVLPLIRPQGPRVSASALPPDHASS